MTLSIAICDDDAWHVQRIVHFVQEYLRLHRELSGQIHTFQRGQELLYQAEETGGFDLYLLDIIMPELNGIQTGQQLRELGNGGEIIYLTISPDYAIDSYSVHAFYYLLKPLDRDRLFDVLDAAVEKLDSRRDKAILVTTKDGPRRILLDQILYVERVGRSLRYVVAALQKQVGQGEHLSCALIQRKVSAVIHRTAGVERGVKAQRQHLLVIPQHLISRIRRRIALIFPRRVLEEGLLHLGDIRLCLLVHLLRPIHGRSCGGG